MLSQNVHQCNARARALIKREKNASTPD